MVRGNSAFCSVYNFSSLYQSSVNLSRTDSNTSLLLEAVLPVSSLYKLSMNVSFSKVSDEPCIVYTTCTNCYSPDECLTQKNNFSQNAFQFRNLTKFGTFLEYRCPLAREFLLVDNGTTIQSQNMTCLWNKTWSPGVTFPPCTCKKPLKMFF